MYECTYCSSIQLLIWQKGMTAVKNILREFSRSIFTEFKAKNSLLVEIGLCLCSGCSKVYGFTILLQFVLLFEARHNIAFFYNRVQLQK